MPRYCEKNLHIGAICPSREKFVPLSVSYMLDIHIISINTMLNTEKYTESHVFDKIYVI